jgi:hypothetical protein
MYTKQRIAFSKKELFGNHFKPGMDSCFCRVSRLVFEGKINPDGTIDINKSGQFTKDDLWSYIYYLFFYNNTNIPVFTSMVNQNNGKASAPLFYQAVFNSESTPLNADIPTLILFINETLNKYGDELVNPIFDYLKVIMQKNIINKISGISVFANNSKTGFEIVTNAEKIKNANVKINFVEKTT